jgi:effector-binding domain-containing protein
MLRQIVSRVLLLFIATVAPPTLLANSPTTQAATQPDFVVSEMRVQTIAGFTYLYASSETTFERVAAPIGATLPAMQKSVSESKFRSVGGPIFVYRNLKDMTQPFTLDIGYAVPHETAATSEYKVRKVEALKCATVMYSGPVAKISEAYGKLMGAISAANLKSTTTAREFYLYWEGAESPNNIVLVQIGIE